MAQVAVVKKHEFVLRIPWIANLNSCHFASKQMKKESREKTKIALNMIVKKIHCFG